MTATLRELTRVATTIDAMLEESEGEITSDIETGLQLLEKELPTKVDSYRHVMLKLESSAETLKKISNMFRDAADVRIKIVERLKNNIKNTMLSMDLNELHGDLYSWKLSKPMSKVVLNGDLTDEFLETEIRQKPNLKKIKDALESGQNVQGAHLEPSRALRCNVRGEKK